MRLSILYFLAASFSFVANAGVYEIKNPVGPSVLKERIRASYGFLSQREPELNLTEYAIIDKFLPFLEEDPGFAIEMIEGLTRNNPDLTASFHLTLGNLYFQTNDLDAAKRSYAKAVEKYPDFLRAWKAIGLLEMHEDNYAAAKRSLGIAAKLGDTDPDTFGLIAFAFYAEADYITALSAYSHALLYAPDSTEWIRGKVSCLLRLKDFTSARTILESLTRKTPKDKDNWTALANVYLETGYQKKAATVLEYLRNNLLSDSQSEELLATLYLDMDMPESAAEVFEKQIERGITPKTDLIIACLFELTSLRLDEKAEVLADRLEQEIESTDIESHLAILRYRGERAMRLKQHEEADALFEQALDLANEKGPILIQRAVNQAIAGELEQAIAYLDLAVIFPPVRQRALRTQTRLLLRLGAFETALNRIQQAIDEGDTSKEAEEIYELALHNARKQELDRLSMRNAALSKPKNTEPK